MTKGRIMRFLLWSVIATVVIGAVVGGLYFYQWLQAKSAVLLIGRMHLSAKNILKGEHLDECDAIIAAYESVEKKFDLIDWFNKDWRGREKFLRWPGREDATWAAFVAYMESGRLSEAREVLAEMKTRGFPVFYDVVRYLIKLQHEQQWEMVRRSCIELLPKEERVYSLFMARASAELGETDQARLWLRELEEAGGEAVCAMGAEKFWIEVRIAQREGQKQDALDKTSQYLEQVDKLLEEPFPKAFRRSLLGRAYSRAAALSDAFGESALAKKYAERALENLRDLESWYKGDIAVITRQQGTLYQAFWVGRRDELERLRDGSIKILSGEKEPSKTR